MSMPGTVRSEPGPHLARRLLHLLRLVGIALAGALAMFLAVFVWYLQDRPGLDVWHTADLDAEFTDRAAVEDFAGYLRLEARLFEQLEQQVYAQVAPERRSAINRYASGSLADPRALSPDWNRTFELTAVQPRASVLLLHGMSDSPYSLRALGQSLNAAGAWVVGLRLPGHGAAPSGLVELRWQSMAAAVRLAIGHLRDTNPGLPIHLIGYSNGGALAVHYALSALDDPALPPVASVVLLSPAIGVSPAAVFAVWQARLGHLLRLEKLAWNSIQPEYDPYKFGSFAVNAGDQVYRLTLEIQSLLDVLGAAGRLGDLPPILAFSSAVDATVSTRALLSGLFERLPQGGHELVVFDLNRAAELAPLLREDPRTVIDALLHRVDLGFTFTLLGNAEERSSELVIRRRSPGDLPITSEPAGLAWPADVYSLAHVSLPFPWDDERYGGVPGTGAGLRLGQLALRGERGVLYIAASDMLRLRANPFYPYVEKRVHAFLGLAPAADEDR